MWSRWLNNGLIKGGGVCASGSGHFENIFAQISDSERNFNGFVVRKKQSSGLHAWSVMYNPELIISSNAAKFVSMCDAFFVTCLLR